MAITKQIVVYCDGVDENGNLAVKRVMRILDTDGSVLAERFTRKVLRPGDDTTNETVDVKTIAQTAWTAARIAKRQADDAAAAAQQPTT